MKNDCAKWKEHLLEAALTGTVAGKFERHLSSCAGCLKELEVLRARRERLDALLPLVARGAEPQPEFGARVLAAAQAASGWKRVRRRVWALAGATAAVVIAMMIGLTLRRTTTRMISDTEVAAAQKLAVWRAPSDVLLETPGQEILRSTPKLGESYLTIPVKTNEED